MGLSGQLQLATQARTSHATPERRGLAAIITGVDEPAEPPPDHPDYRFTLANERTFLAWIRTALALVAAGVAVAQFVPEFSLMSGGRRVLGVLSILLALAVSVVSYARWRRNEQAVRLDQPLPPSRLPLVIAAGLVVIAALAFVFVVLS